MTNDEKEVFDYLHLLFKILYGLELINFELIEKSLTSHLNDPASNNALVLKITRAFKDMKPLAEEWKKTGEENARAFDHANFN